MSVCDNSKYRDNNSRVASASRPSDAPVNPTRSANSTEIRRRSATGAAAAVRVATATDASATSSGAPQSPQKLFPGGFSAPHVGQLFARALPQSPQNRLAAGFSAPQFAHAG